MSPREQEYKAKGVEIIAINAFENPQLGRDWIAASDVHFQWAIADKALTEAFGVETVPTQIIIDRDGNVAWTSSLTSVFGGADAVFEALDEVL